MVHVHGQHSRSTPYEAEEVTTQAPPSPGANQQGSQQKTGLLSTDLVPYSSNPFVTLSTYARSPQQITPPPSVLPGLTPPNDNTSVKPFSKTLGE